MVLWGIFGPKREEVKRFVLRGLFGHKREEVKERCC